MSYMDSNQFVYYIAVAKHILIFAGMKMLLIIAKQCLQD